MNKLLKGNLILVALFFVLGGIFTANSVSAEKEAKTILVLNQSPSKPAPKESKSEIKVIKTATPKKPNDDSPQTSGSNPKQNPVNPTPTKTQKGRPETPADDAATVQTQTNTDDPKPAVTPKTNEENSGNWLDSIWSLLYWVLLGGIGLVVLGLTGWFIYYVLTNIWREKDTNIQGFRKVREAQKQMAAEISELSKLVKLQNDRIARQDKSIQSFQSQLKAENSSSSTARSQPVIEEPQFVKPEPQFPVSAENYLNKVGNQGEMATPDKFSEGLLVQDPSKDQEFIIIKDPETADGLYYAVPKFTRFSTKSDYNLYYRTYYDCENPSGGTVWIKSPAIMDRVEGGWRLRDKGELEVR